MKFDNCIVTAESCDNGTLRLKKVSEELLIATTTCKCGCEVAEARFGTGIGSHILEQLASARLEAEERGRSRFSAPISEPHSIKRECARCHRVVMAVVNFTLDSKLLRSFDKSHQEGEGSGIYGGLLRVEARVKKGWFAEFKLTNDPRALLRPTCVCGNQLISNDAREAFEKMVKAITDVFEVQDALDPETTETKEVLSCPYCFNKLKLDVKLMPLLPESDGLPAYILAYRQWSERTQEMTVVS